MFPIETFQLTLAKFTSIVRQLDVRFHLTGGLTGTAYGEPRMTQDIDIVIAPERSKVVINDLVMSLQRSDFMHDEAAVRHAVRTGGMFQLLDNTECLKLDIYCREMIPGELSRSELLEIFAGEFLPVASRADAAASKLAWISKGSHKSRRDLRAIVRNATPDQRSQIKQSAADLGLVDLLDEVLNEPDEIE